MRGAVVELWQANAAGRYFHPIDQRDAPLDPNFVGNGRIRTDEEGALRLFHDQAGRLSGAGQGDSVASATPGFPILGPSSLSRLVT